MFAAVGALILGACDSGSSSSASSSRPVPRIGNGQGPPGIGTGRSSEAPAEGPGALKGGTITVLTSRRLPARLDPVVGHRTELGWLEAGLLVRSLTQWKYDPMTKHVLLVPDLAIDLGKSNDTYKRWRFTLGHHLRFENGAPLTARAVVRGIRRCVTWPPPERAGVSPATTRGYVQWVPGWW